MVLAFLTYGPETAKQDADVEAPFAVKRVISATTWDAEREAKKDRCIPTLAEGRPAIDDNIIVYKGQSQAVKNFCHAAKSSVLLIKDGPQLVTTAAGQTSCWGRSVWDSSGPAAATGFFVDKQGLIATNFHVVKDKQKIFARTSDGKLYPTESIWADAASDIAILRIKKSNSREEFPALKLGSSEKLQVAEEVNIVGHPLARIDLFISPGKVTKLDTETTRHIAIVRPDLLQDKFLKLSNHIELGSSGSPVLDKNSHVVGICFARYCPAGKTVPTVTLATRVEEIAKAIRMAKYGQGSK